MLFNSYGFVFAFFPLLLAVCYACLKIENKGDGTKYAALLLPGALLLASLLFYGFERPEYLPVFLGSMGINYFLFRLMERVSAKGKKAVLFVGLVFHLLSLIHI